MRVVFWILLISSIFKLVVGDALIEIWRKYDDMIDSISEELEIIESQIESEKKSIEALNHLTGLLGATVNDLESVQSSKHNNCNFNFEKIDELMGNAERHYNERHEELMRKEAEMEDLWKDENFRISFEFILDKSALTPQPAAPMLEANEMKELMRFREHVLKDQAKGAEDLKGNLKRINDQMDAVERVLKNVNRFESLNSAIETVKMNIESKLGKSLARDLTGFIDEFRKNQEVKDELFSEIQTMRTLQVSKERINEDLEDARGFWSIRLGALKAFEGNTKSKSFIPDNVIATAKNTLRPTVMNKDDALLAKLKQKYDLLQSRPENNHFMIRKYIKYIESFYDFWTKNKMSSPPLTIIGEAIKELIL